MQITIRNESSKTIEITYMKGTIHEVGYTLVPHTYLTVPSKEFHMVYIPTSNMKLSGGVLKIKD